MEGPSSAHERKIGDYEIVRQLGVGGMATVHLAREKGSSGRSVALKVLHDFVAEDPASVAMLRDEARLSACIRHPNVVKTLGIVEADAEGGAPALIMEHVEGLSLSKLQALLTSSGRRLPLDVVAAVVRDILEGLHAAHEATRDDGYALAIVHRDVSPQNVLVGIDGRVRLTDFGIARATWRIQATDVGAIKGKLGYMAPEQLDGREDRRADIFAVGVIAWELLTGQRLRAADGSGARVLVEILHGGSARPSTHAPDVIALDDVVMRALSQDPDGRFATAREMADVITQSVAPAAQHRTAEVLASVLGRAARPIAVRRRVTRSGVIRRGSLRGAPCEATFRGCAIPSCSQSSPLWSRELLRDGRDEGHGVQTEYELTIGASDVFWIEKRATGAAAQWFVRRAAK